jgi:hypothetical protein
MSFEEELVQIAKQHGWSVTRRQRSTLDKHFPQSVVIYTEKFEVEVSRAFTHMMPYKIFIGFTIHESCLFNPSIEKKRFKQLFAREDILFEWGIYDHAYQMIIHCIKVDLEFVMNIILLVLEQLKINSRASIIAIQAFEQAIQAENPYAAKL